MPSSPPPYVRIADELRARIRALHPGNRVPSTRQIAEASGVAMATASKALHLLAREGLIEAIPRVGNVARRVPSSPASSSPSGPSPATSAPAGELGPARIVAAAIAIADRAGLDAVSLRGVSARMGVPVMSLYRHIASKEDLVRRMVDTVMGEWPHPEPPASWRAQVEMGARLEWQALRRHPWMARVVTVTRPDATRNALKHADWMLRGFEAAGADAPTRLSMHIVIYGFVQGLASNLEAETLAEDETGLDERQWMESRMPAFTALAASGEFPAFARTVAELAGSDGREDFEPDLDTLFELALGLLLDGFARRLEGDAGRASRKRKRLRAE